jgi:putative membrane protein
MFFTRVISTASMVLAVVACSPDANQRDPVADAKFQNEKRIGEQDITKKQEHDAEFMVNSAGQGMLELELSKLAQQKATTPAVKTFAAQLVQQHADMSNSLKSVADKKSIVLPTGLGADQQEQVKKLSNLGGAAFDKQYMETIVDAHKDDVDSFDDMSDDAYDGDIRGFAAKYLPVLKEHLTAAQQVQDQVKDLK